MVEMFAIDNTEEFRVEIASADLAQSKLCSVDLVLFNV